VNHGVIAVSRCRNPVRYDRYPGTVRQYRPQHRRLAARAPRTVGSSSRRRFIPRPDSNRPIGDAGGGHHHLRRTDHAGCPPFMPEVPPSRPRRFRILSTRWCRGVAVTLGRLLTARYSGERHDGRLTVTWSPPTIHRPERPRQPRHLEPLDLDPSERLAPDHRLDVQVEAAAVTHDLFDRVEPTLPRPDLRVAAEPVLQEGEPTSWPEHPKDLDQSLLDLGDAAHGPGAHHAVEDPVVKWQSLAARGPLIDFDPTGSDPSPGLLVHAGVGIDRGDLADVLGIVGQV
jgi:hypothetical protein